MVDVVDSRTYLDAMLALERPGASKVHAFYEHRVGKICQDPQLMLMPWDDHLVHRGDGVFEAIKFVDGKIYQLDPHLDRMKRSSLALHMEPPCSWADVRKLVLAVCRAGGQSNGIVRVFLGRGAGGFGIYPSECPETSLYIVANDLSVPPASCYEEGCTAFKTSIPAKQPYLATIKSIDYLPNVLMKREAQEKGYDYPLCFDENGFLAEGATENICVVTQDGTLVVPESSHSLAGTTLLRSLELIQDELPVVYRGISEKEIHVAKELIIVGTSGDAIPVVRFNDVPIHDAKPGPVSKRIRELLQEDLRSFGIQL